jgi:hypothetical protein
LEWAQKSLIERQNLKNKIYVYSLVLSILCFPTYLFT